MTRRPWLQRVQRAISRASHLSGTSGPRNMGMGVSLARTGKLGEGQVSPGALAWITVQIRFQPPTLLSAEVWGKDG